MSSAFSYYYPTIWGYGLAALIFTGFAVQIRAGWRGGIRACLLLAAVATSALWAGSVCAAVGLSLPELWQLARFLDAARLASWLAFLFVQLFGWGLDSATQDRPSRLAWLAAGLAALLIAGVALPQPEPGSAPAPGWAAATGFAATLGVSALGLILCEQLYRRTPDTRRWAVKPLVIGLGGMFAFDLVIYSAALMFRIVDPAMSAARGVAAALAMFFVAIATARNAGWTQEWRLSRGVVLHSTAAVLAGAYLLIVAAAGYWVRLFGGGWGETLQVAMVFAGLLLFAVLALSGSMRSWLKVFISKHFFRYRYDYRSEWLRFTRALATPAEGETFNQQAVRAIADLVESTGGALWLEYEDGFRQAARVNSQRIRDTVPASDPLVTYLSRTGWIIRLDEYVKFPERYPELIVPDWMLASAGAWLVIPLPSGQELIGFVVLAKPRTAVEVNWEVLDLLKTASRQAASFLAHKRADEILVESQKFDAFNRMSAFVVHDLKNLVAQLILLLKNAERHRDNPEFQKDMLDTVEHVVGRMNRLMLQLGSGTSPIGSPQPVDVREIVERVVKSKQSQRARIDADLTAGLWALAHEDRVERVISHVVQNAIEASEPGTGQIRLRAYADSRYAVIEIVDHGVGMTEEFVRERLFHPFQTTKPQGMGIGMYESFQYVSGIGGHIAVESSPGRGSRFRVCLRCANATQSDNKPLAKVA